MEQAIGKKFNFFSLVRFAFPTICMMVFFSLYTVIDGIFVSRYVGEDALAAVNIVYPMINITIGLAIMFATGGCAIVAKTMGEGNLPLAKQRFSSIIAVATAFGIGLAAISLLFLTPCITFLGATPVLLQYCYDYAQIMMAFAPVMILKLLFDYFFVAAGKPSFGFYNALLGGITNIALDWLLIAYFDFGIKGAAWATVIGYALPAAMGLFYFGFGKNPLRFSKFAIETNVLLKTCSNGSSEMVTQLSLGLTTYLFNILMLRYIGEAGVTAITIVLYAEFLLTAIFLGFSSGVAPIISYHYGSANREELKKILRNCYKFILLLSGISFAFAQGYAEPLILIFTGADSAVYPIALRGFRLFAFSFLFVGFTILSSSVFTAFSNGKTSALISFMRNCALLVFYMLLLPMIFKLDGIWLAVPITDATAIFVSAYFIRKYRIFHGYI